MTTGLPADLTDANNEWVLDFSNFRTAWEKTKGAGITIAHPDTGWTSHPELVPPKYRRDLSKNFFEPVKNARNVYPPDPDSWSAEDDITHWLSTAHGTGTAGVIVSPRGHPNGSPPQRTDKFLAESAATYVSGAAPEAQVIPFPVTDDPMLLDDQDSALADCILGLAASCDPAIASALDPLDHQIPVKTPSRLRCAGQTRGHTIRAGCRGRRHLHTF